MNMVSLSKIAVINPPGPKPGSLAPDDELDFVPMASVGEDGQVKVTDRRLYSEVAKGFTAFCNNDVLVAKITPCFENNKIAVANITTEYAFGSTEFHVVRCSPMELNPRYLAHFLRQDRIRYAGERRMTGSAGQRRVPKLFLDELKIPLPQLDKQKRIASILDQADVLRRLRQRAIEQLDDLRQAVFYEMFGDPTSNPMDWPKSKISDSIIDVTNGITRRRKDSELGENIVLRLRDIRNGRIDFSDINRITLNPKEVAKYAIVPGDILFVRVNGNPDYVGRSTVFQGYSEAVFFNDHIMRVRLDASKINSRFLSFILNSAHGKREIALHRKTSAGQHTINQDGLGKIEIPMPPIEIQLNFDNRLASIEEQLCIHSGQRTTLDALFSSLQQHGFEGLL